MKAAIINAFGEVPQYGDLSEPLATGSETLVHVKASVLENFDKLTVSGKHYSSQKLFPAFPAVPGTDGIGMTEDGRLVGFGAIRAPYGAFSEKTVAGFTMPIPAGIDVASAAAIPPSVLTSLLPLKYSAKLQPGETVLINGATGVSGRIAVQVARLLGAGKIVGTGRNKRSLEIVRGLGVDEAIDLNLSDEALAEAFRAHEGPNGYDVVVDFLWGLPAEVLIRSLIPDEVGFAKRRIRYLAIGEKAGANITLPAAALRTSGLEMMGVGKVSHAELFEEMARIWEWMKEDKFYMEIERVPLAEIAAAWGREELAGKRLVVVM